MSVEWNPYFLWLVFERSKRSLNNMCYALLFLSRSYTEPQKSRLWCLPGPVLRVRQESLLQVVSPVYQGFHFLVLIPMNYRVSEVSRGPPFSTYDLRIGNLGGLADYEPYYVPGLYVGDSYSIECPEGQCPVYYGPVSEVPRLQVCGNFDADEYGAVVLDKEN